MPEHLRAKYLGRVFQDPMAGTAPDLTIEQNLSLALKRGQSRGLGRGTTSARREHFKDELATLELGLENRLKTKVGLLSGGQRQALSLLMAGFTQPRILLLDEHTGTRSAAGGAGDSADEEDRRERRVDHADGHAQYGAGDRAGQSADHDARGADHLPGHGRTEEGPDRRDPPRRVLEAQGREPGGPGAAQL